jgi:hypothetical protein
MLYPIVLRCSTVFQPIITVYACIVKVSHDHVLLVRICNNLMHMWHHVTNHLIISNDKDYSENRIKLRIRATIVNEWVKGVNAWLRGQIINQRWLPTDEQLWNEVFDSFNRQFANVMEQEDAQAALAKGLQLEKGDLDKLITEFEQLGCHAGYDINQDLVLCIFTSALPNAMYEYILHTMPVNPTYKQWQAAAIDQQRIYVHMRNRANRFKTKSKPPPTNNWKPFNTQWKNFQRDPNAMDTSLG